MKKRSNKSPIASKFHYLEEIKFYKVYILFGTEALLNLSEDMMLAISSLSVDCRNIVLLLSFERLSEKSLCEYFMPFL